MKKKILFFLIIITSCLIFFYQISVKSIGDKDSILKNITNNFFSIETRKFLKEKIFFYDTIDRLKKINAELKNANKEQFNIISRNSYNFLKNSEIINFKYEETKTINTDKYSFNLKKYSNQLFRFTGPKAYLYKFNNYIFLINGMGNIFYSESKKFDDEQISFKKLKNNLNKYLKPEDGRKNSVMGLIIIDQNLYVSFLKKEKDKCYYVSILKSKFEISELNFEEFFETKECAINYGLEAGGAMEYIGENTMLFSVGTLGSHMPPLRKDQAQNLNSLRGKILKINILTKKYSILAAGVRNVQGIYYNKNNNEVFFSDHGPEGGDEINVIKNMSQINNYGWGIASCGRHYTFLSPKDKKERYEVLPLKKSHKKYGFIEPITFFDPSIGPSELLIEDNFTNEKNKKFYKTIYVSALGNKLDEGDMSIHKISIDNKYKIIDRFIIPIGERIRNFIFTDNGKKILMFLENSGSIAELKLSAN